MAPAVVDLTCSTCGRLFPRLASEVRKTEKRGSKPYCSQKCLAERNIASGNEKVCTQCGRSKSLEDFFLHPMGALGRASRCKTCDSACVDRDAMRERSRKSYEKNRETVLTRGRERRETPEGAKRCRENVAAWRVRNLEHSRIQARRRYVAKKYDLTVEEYDAILARGCAICGSTKGRTMGKRNPNHLPPTPRLCLDHDHASGKNRDALCHSCNSGLGLFKDNPERLRKAATYLENHRRDQMRLNIDGIFSNNTGATP